MAEQRRVVLYGNSIVLSSLGASLERGGRCEVVRLSPPLPDRAELEKLEPDAILFDTENARPDAAFTLLETRPNLLVFGLSPDCNVLRLWSGRQYQELSTMDVRSLIESGSQGG